MVFLRVGGFVIEALPRPRRQSPVFVLPRGMDHSAGVIFLLPSDARTSRRISGIVSTDLLKYAEVVSVSPWPIMTICTQRRPTRISAAA